MHVALDDLARPLLDRVDPLVVAHAWGLPRANAALLAARPADEPCARTGDGCAAAVVGDPARVRHGPDVAFDVREAGPVASSSDA